MASLISRHRESIVGILAGFYEGAYILGTRVAKYQIIMIRYSTYKAFLACALVYGFVISPVLGRADPVSGNADADFDGHVLVDRSLVSWAHKPFDPTKLTIYQTDIVPILARAADISEVRDQPCDRAQYGLFPATLGVEDQREFVRLRREFIELANGTSDRGNGDAVLLRDGKLHMVDLLTDEERKNQLSERVLNLEESSTCGKNSFHDAQMLGNIAHNIALLSEKKLSPEVALWLKMAYYRFRENVVFTDYGFPSYQGTWKAPDSMPENRLIPVDFAAGPFDVFRHKVFDRLDDDGKVAAVARAMIRVGQFEYDGVGTQLTDDQIGPVVKSLLQQSNLASLDQIFHVPEARQLVARQNELALAIQECLEDQASKKAIPRATLEKLQASLSAFNQDFYGPTIPTYQIYRMATMTPLPQSRGQRLDSTIIDSHDGVWRAQVQATQNLIQELSKVKTPLQASLLTKLKNYADLTSKYSSYAIKTQRVSDSIEGTNPRALLTDSKGQALLCNLIDGILSVSPHDFQNLGAGH